MMWDAMGGRAGDERRKGSEVSLAVVAEADEEAGFSFGLRGGADKGTGGRGAPRSDFEVGESGDAAGGFVWRF
jgi:hypothetical protein